MKRSREPPEAAGVSPYTLQIETYSDGSAWDFIPSGHVGTVYDRIPHKAMEVYFPMTRIKTPFWNRGYYYDFKDDHLVRTKMVPHTDHLQPFYTAVMDLYEPLLRIDGRSKSFKLLRDFLFEAKWHAFHEMPSAAMFEGRKITVEHVTFIQKSLRRLKSVDPIIVTNLEVIRTCLETLPSLALPTK